MLPRNLLKLLQEPARCVVLWTPQEDPGATLLSLYWPEVEWLKATRKITQSLKFGAAEVPIWRRRTCAYDTHRAFKTDQEAPPIVIATFEQLKVHTLFVLTGIIQSLADTRHGDTLRCLDAVLLLRRHAAVEKMA